jgi:uncharacterized phage protein (TIGR01671 family)
MRTNKFRAWDKIHNKMSNSFTLLSAINQDQAFVNPENFDYVQYTGLKDKNGVEIYEGYICEITGVNYRYMFEIVWDEQVAGFSFEQVMYGLSDMEFMPDYLDWVEKLYRIQVIGNIYENPELLEDK